MATPTASSKVLHNAATPQSQPHLAAFSSPVPRSVPSPAAQRGGQAGKSPFNTSTHAPTTASTATALNHPTGGSSGSATRGLLGSSPAPAMLNLESPIPGMLTPSFSNMGALFSSVGMGLTGSGLSGMGGLSMTGPPSEEERRRRLEDVVAQVKQRPGRVSPDGVKLLAERSGFDAMLDTKKDGTQGCAIAGGYIVVDIAFNIHHRVSTVLVEISSSSTAVNDNAASASTILHQNLSIPPHLSTMTVTLDKFAKNLEKLAQLDKPNGRMEQTFNCFEAISGIYISLRKLFEHEKQVALSLLGAGNNLEEKAELEVTCKKSGRPTMNARNEIGLSLDYWIQRGHVHSKEIRIQNHTDLEGDRNMDSGLPSDQFASDASNIFSLSIGCQGPLSDLYSPARISEAWISDQIERPPDDPTNSFGPMLDWLDPPPTYRSIPHEEHPNTLAADGSLGKLPNVRFVAKLQPPLVLPWEAMLQVLGSVGVPQDTIIGQCNETYFDALLLQPNFQDAVTVSAQTTAAHKETRMKKVVLVAGEGGCEGIRVHNNALFIPKRDHAGLLQEIPFDHPKQLVHLLPVLRQYAFLNTLLKESFLPDALSSLQFGPARLGAWSVDMTLSISQGPKLSIAFPRTNPRTDMPSSSKESVEDLVLDILTSGGNASENSSNEHTGASISVTMDVLPNADLSVIEQNIMPPSNHVVEGTESEQQETEKSMISKLARAIVISGDIGIWTEWASKWAASLGK